LTKYFRQYVEGGIERLKEVKFYRPQSNLKEFSVMLELFCPEIALQKRRVKKAIKLW
jgi:hypothetical protein